MVGCMRSHMTVTSLRPQSGGDSEFGGGRTKTQPSARGWRAGRCVMLLLVCCVPQPLRRRTFKARRKRQEGGAAEGYYGRVS